MIPTRHHGYMDAINLGQPSNWNRTRDEVSGHAEAWAQLRRYAPFAHDAEPPAERLRSVCGFDPLSLWREYGDYWEGYYEGEFHRFHGEPASGEQLNQQWKEAHDRHKVEWRLLRSRLQGIFPDWRDLPRDPPPRAEPNTPASHSTPPVEGINFSLDHILDELDKHHQRATYSAVGQLLGRPPSFLMSGRPRDHRHSWVVNQKTHMPTGYTEEQMHPALQEREEVLADFEELAHWLRSPR